MQNIAIVLCNNMHMDIERANMLITLISQSRSYQLTSNYTKADVVIVLTCAYSNEHKKKTMHIIADIQANARNGANVIITGCLVNGSKKELCELFPEFEVQTFNKVKAMLNENSLNNFSVKRFIPQNKVIISMGCLKKCSYCVYSKLEQNYTSKPMEAVMEEVAELYEAETTIYITGGQETSDYGIDLYGKVQFATLMDKICTQYPNCSYVIGWFHPSGLTDEVIHLIAKHHNIKEIMLHIQHVSNRILSEANRPSFEGTNQKINVLKELRNDLVISTQVITGLPGETEDEFNSLISYLDNGVFSDIGVSSYEEVENTPSSKSSNQVPFGLRIKRMDEIVLRYGATPYKGEMAESLSNWYMQFKKMLHVFPNMILSEKARQNYKNIAGTDTDYKEQESFSELITNVFTKVLNSRDELEVERTHEWITKTFTKEFRDSIYGMFESAFPLKAKVLDKAKQMLE